MAHLPEEKRELLILARYQNLKYGMKFTIEEKLTKRILIIGRALLSASGVNGQRSRSDRVAVPLSGPSRSAMLTVDQGSGGESFLYLESARAQGRTDRMAAILLARL
jgi:hypothetical protein